MVRFDLASPQGQMRRVTVKSACTSLITGPKGLQFQTNLSVTMDWTSFDVVRIDLEPFLQGQMRVAKLKSAIIPVNNLAFS